MLYNTEVHIPQLIELLIKDYREGDGDKLESDKKMLGKISESLNNNFLITEDEYKNRKNELDEDFLEKLVAASLEGDKILDVFIEIDKIKKEYLEKLGELNEDKWETIFSKTIKHIKTTEKHGEV